MKSGLKPRELTLLGLLTAILLVMSFTPLGYLYIGPLAITLNMIPVAVAAAALGPVGGAVTGGVFGLTSFLQAMGVGGGGGLGAILMQISPARTAVQCFVPRLLTGVLTGLIYRLMKKTPLEKGAGFVTGGCAAVSNTALFMSSLVLLFGQTEYLQGLIAGRNVLVFICAFVGVNAVFEALASTLATGLVVRALERARMIGRS